MSLTERFGTFGGFTTRYLDAGQVGAPLMLLLHDGAFGGCSSTTWAKSIPFLASNFRVIAPDMLGFGGTDKAVFFDRAPYASRIDHLVALMKTLAPHEPFHIVGTSFGGSVALRWLAQGGPFLSATSLAGSGGPWRTQESIDGLKDWDGTRADMERLLALLIDREPNFDSLVDDRIEWAKAPGHYRSLVSAGMPIPEPLKSARDADPWPSQLSGTTVPLHLIAGSRDTLLEPEWVERIASARPDATISILDGARHSPNLVDPEGVVRVITEFATTLD